MPHSSVCFFFNDTATTEIYTLSLHDALPIWYTKERDVRGADLRRRLEQHDRVLDDVLQLAHVAGPRSEEHTSELQSQSNLVCRLLLEKKKGHHAGYLRVDLPRRDDSACCRCR